MKQQADKEMTSIRRILDILGALSQAQQTRVMAFVNARVADTSMAVLAQNLSDVRLAGVANEIDPRDFKHGVKPSRAAQLPFPDADTTKRTVEAMGRHADNVAGAILGTANANGFGNEKDNQ